MPYRAMFNTLISIVLALVIVTTWEIGVQRQIERSEVAESARLPKGTGWQQAEAAHSAPGVLGHPHEALLKLRVGVSILSLMLLGALFLVGLFATFREWIRMRIASPPRKRHRTKYVDAWKIAAERMSPPPDAPDPPAAPEK